MDHADRVTHEDDGRVMYLRCARCTVCIGPGFHYDEVWYDPSIKKKICRGCGQLHVTDGAWEVLDEDELKATGGGVGLVKELKRRIAKGNS